MTESHNQEGSGQLSAGAQLRAARESAGVHIGALATTLKVPVRKLEWLEGDRFDELHDATFVRALALAVCRSLKCDPGPVLAALPRQQAVVSALEGVQRGTAASFSLPSGSQGTLRLSTGFGRWWWGVAALLAVALWWVAQSWNSWDLPASRGGESSSAPAGAAALSASAPVPVLPAAPESTAPRSSSVLQATAPAAASAANGSPVIQTVHGVPAAAARPGNVAELNSFLTVSEPSWIEVLDSQGRQVWARTLTPGESVALDETAGFKLTIGNAAATQVRWRGQRVDLTGGTRDNVARIELK